jgi:hypothetical protein
MNHHRSYPKSQAAVWEHYLVAIMVTVVSWFQTCGSSCRCSQLALDSLLRQSRSSLSSSLKGSDLSCCLQFGTCDLGNRTSL